MRAPAAGGRKKTLRGSRLPEKGGNSRIFFPASGVCHFRLGFRAMP